MPQVTQLKDGTRIATWAARLREALGQNPFACLFQRLEAAQIPWLTASSIFKARKGRSWFSHSDTDSPASVFHI